MKISINNKEVFIATSRSGQSLTPPVLVFLHGAGMDHSFWSGQLQGFAKAGFSVIAPDLPGHGQSEGPAPAQIEDYATWLFELLETMDIAQVMIAGHSMGSLIALETALRLNTRVEKLAMLGTAMPMRVSEALLEAAADDLPAAASMISRFGFAEDPFSKGEPLAGKLMQQACRQQIQQSVEGVLYNALSACNSYSEKASTFKILGCPVHLIIGDSDRMTPPKAAKALADLLPRVTEETLKDCGHMHTLEQPLKTQEALERFFVS